MKFDHFDYWKAITLYGLNVATYKPALATCLLKAARDEKTEILWADLSSAFLIEYQKRLKTNPMPQQTNAGRRTKLERIVHQLEIGDLSFSKARDLVGKDGFVDVVPRFHNIGSDSEFAASYFYECEFGKKLVLKDTILNIANQKFSSLIEETQARWSLLEGAFAINHKDYDFELANDIREIYLTGGYERKPLTGNIPFLSGYQGNVCFYCGEDLDDVAVDHVLPRQVINHDEVWNLVLAHSHCNSLKSDLLIGIHFIEKLIRRNENIMGSNHPWRGKIQAQLGNTPAKRSSALLRHYENVKTVRGSNFWGGVPTYNPETDPFYRKLITKLNGG